MSFSVRVKDLKTDHFIVYLTTITKHYKTSQVLKILIITIFVGSRFSRAISMALADAVTTKEAKRISDKKKAEMDSIIREHEKRFDQKVAQLELWRRGRPQRGRRRGSQLRLSPRPWDHCGHTGSICMAWDGISEGDGVMTAGGDV